ncbi:hypothetical protein [Aquimarina pacifica]|uniref:hypothetical protein n=1 Tax=Aquimarina pacifica TaxID=1296415 RepID=UPI0012693940|nr:hypothetical protein [Aquimarina pacifica]
MLASITIATLYFSLNEKLPKGKSGQEADNFALKIQKAVRHEAFIQTDYIQWTFRNKHHYIWDKKQGLVTVQWDEHTAYLNLIDSSKSRLKNNTISKSKKEKLLTKALAFFNNDSFWVVAPHKLFDKGVTREIVTLEDNTKALLVKYASGGTTPGDSYLWKVNKNHLPLTYKMWVSIIPIGGIEATWENWTTTQSGAYISQQHKLLGFGIPISNLKTWSN